VYLLVLLIILIALSAFFSASETALTSVSKIKLLNMIDENVETKRSEKILKLMENPQKLLSAILIGNNIVNIGASSIATLLAIKFFPYNGVGVATAVMTVIVLIFGEITPKTMAAQEAEKLALGVVNIINIIVIVLTPTIAVLNIVTGFLVRVLGGNSDEKTPTITQAELKTMVNVSHEEGILQGEEKKMLNNVFDFRDSRAIEVMTPRTDISALEKDASYEDVVNIFKEEKFSRIPIYEESLDNIIGVLYLKDVFAAGEKNFSIVKVMREPYYTYETKDISSLLKEMRTKRVGLAVVLDEYGGTSGIVTVEDLVEEIMGKISDEFDDDDDEISAVKEDEYIVDGTARIDDVNEMIGTNIECIHAETIGGYVTVILGRFAKKGEVVEDSTNHLVMTVEEIDKNRIDSLRIKKITVEENDDKKTKK
jgi:putative hemolysin